MLKNERSKRLNGLYDKTCAETTQRKYQAYIAMKDRHNVINTTDQYRELRKQENQCIDIRKTNSQKESKSFFRNV